MSEQTSCGNSGKDENWELFLQSVSNPSFIVSSTRKLVAANQKFLEILGDRKTADFFFSKAFVGLFQKMDSAEHENLSNLEVGIESWIAGDPSTELRLKGLHLGKDTTGSHWLCLVDAQDYVRESFFQDHHENMIHSARLSALGEMAAGIAHEINNPLTVILAKAHFMEKKITTLQGDPSLIDAAQKVQQHAFRISRVVRGLRSFSREDSASPMRETSITSIIEDCLALCAERVKASGVRLYSHVPDGDCRIIAHDYQISQIIVNLLNNAYDAVETIPFAEITLKVEHDGEWLTVCVWDNGPGIPPEIERKIMLPFFTTKETGKGTGLGLSISLGIARTHNGDLRLNRSIGPSCFELILPLANAGSQNESYLMKRRA